MDVHAIIFSWNIKPSDIRMAFLYNLLLEQTYVQSTDGYELTSDKVQEGELPELHHMLYGLVHAVRVWMKILLVRLSVKELKLIRLQVDPCLMSKQDSNKFIAISIDMDKCAIMEA